MSINIFENYIKINLVSMALNADKDCERKRASRSLPLRR